MSRFDRKAYLASPPTIYQRIAAIVGPALILGAAVFLLLMWRSIPERIPTSFDISGEPNAWDSRNSLWAMPVIGAFAMLTFALVGRFPSTWNTGIRVTEENRPFVYRAIRDMIADMEISMGVFFCGFTVFSATVPESMSPFIIVPIFVLILWPIVRLLIRFIRIKRAFG